jgi:hypothetical protein
MWSRDWDGRLRFGFVGMSRVGCVRDWVLRKRDIDKMRATLRTWDALVK